VCQAQDQVAEFIVDWWAARLVGIGPFSGDQAAVPGQQRRRGDDAMPMQVEGEQIRISTSLAAALRVSNLNQPNTTQEIRYSSQNSTVRDHGMIT
jgi:hypothetical protein